jgi:hypothetical protein
LKPQNTILEELKEVAPTLMEVGVDLPFTVPNDYFEQLAETILEKATIGLIPNADKKGFQVPDQYFSGLANKILQRVKESDFEESSLFEETEFIAPILNIINKGMPYTVPDNYFEKLSIQIPVEKAKIVPMKKMRNWMTYAAAAIFVGIMVTGSFLFSDKNQEQDFEKYQNLDVAAALDKVSDTELNTYIDENHAASVDDLTESDRSNFDNVDDKIQSMSSENLNQYLNENGFLEMKPENSVEK